MNNKVLLTAVVVLVIGGGALLLLNNKAQTQPTDQTTQNTTPTQAVQQEETQITVTSSGYNPKTVTVKPGAKVVWKNETGGPITVSSDNHPTHLLWPFLNLGKLSNFSSISVWIYF